MLAATPGLRAGAVLASATAAAPFFGAKLIGSLGVGTFHESYAVDPDRHIAPDVDAEFRTLPGRLAFPRKDPS